jgi:hypothetical protein
MDMSFNEIKANGTQFLRIVRVGINPEASGHNNGQHLLSFIEGINPAGRGIN